MQAPTLLAAFWRWAKAAAVVLCFLTAGVTLPAASYLWIGGVGAWDVPANWNPQGVPGPGDQAVIETGNIFIPASSNALRVGSFYQYGGGLHGPGALVVESYYHWKAGALSGGGGRLINLGTMMIENTNTVFLGDWTLECGMYSINIWRGSAPLFLHSGAVITNSGYFSWETVQPVFSSNLNVQVVNAGTMAINTSTGLVVLNPLSWGTPPMTFRNEGTLDISSGGMRLEGAELWLEDSSLLRFFLAGTNELSERGVVESLQTINGNGFLEVHLESSYPWPQNYSATLVRGNVQGDFLGTYFEPGNRNYWLTSESWPNPTVTLMVESLPPFPLQQPVSWELPPGKEFVLFFIAGGTGPHLYQWYKDDEPIPGANGTVYQVWSATKADEGAYYCVASTFYGVTTSEVVQVSVVAPPRLLSFTASIDSFQLWAESSPDSGELVFEMSEWNPTGPFYPLATSNGPPGATHGFEHEFISQFGYFYRIGVRGPLLGTMIYATNVVGCWWHDLSPEYNLIAQPFWSMENTLNQLFLNVPEGAEIVTISSNQLETYYYTPLYGWVDESMVPTGRQVMPMEGFYFYNPLPSRLKLLTAGELPVGNVTNAIPWGKCVVAPPFPFFLGTLLPEEGDRLWTFDEETQSLVGQIFLNGTWHGGGGFFSLNYRPYWFEPAHPGGDPPPEGPARTLVGWIVNSGYNEDYGYTYSPVVYTGPPHFLVPQSSLGGPPEIVVQPVSQTVSPGEDAFFEVEAVGELELAYQWYHEGMPLATGADGPVLTIANAQPVNAGAYYVVVSNPWGSVTSQVALLQVELPPPPQVVAWGSGSHGSDFVPPGLNNVVAIAVGWYHSLALRADGTIVGWGDSNNYGQTNVPPGLTNAVAIAAGWYHNLALRRDGTVVAWGRNDEGQTNVPVNLTNVAAIAAGPYHSLALRANGTVAAWGRNAYGQINVPLGLSNVVAIAGGEEHSLALRADGTVMAWGDNTLEQTNVPAGLSNVVAIAAGDFHNLALRADGTVVAWGQNIYGESSVPEGLTNVVAVAAGRTHSLALRADGTVVAWGEDELGATNVPVDLTNAVAIAASWLYSLALQGAGPPYLTGPMVPRSAGLGQTVYFAAPATGARPLTYQWYFNGAMIPGADRPWLAVSNVQPAHAGAYHVVVSNSEGLLISQTAQLQVEGAEPAAFPPVVAWGSNEYGQTNVPPGLSNVIGVAAGFRHALAIRSDGTVVGWGANWDGRATPPAGLSNVVSLAIGSAHNLALLANGTVVGWGYNNSGQATPPAWLDNVVAVAAGREHSLALRADGTLVGWGLNWYNLTNIPAGLSNVVGIAAGDRHNLALLADGTVVGWGFDGSGQATPPLFLDEVVAVAAGYAHSLALRADGTVVGWGNNQYGAISIPDGLSNVVAIAAGDYHSLAMKADGTVVVWGRNDLGQLDWPAGLTQVVAVEGGGEFSLALRGAGPPVIAPLVNLRTAFTGEKVVFYAQAAGQWPLSYQWYSNGIPIMGANRPWLVLSNVQPEYADIYHVVVSNAEGMEASQEAVLQVGGVRPVLPRQVVGWGGTTYGVTPPPPGLSNVVAVAAGGQHGLALLRDGTVTGWGSNHRGQLNFPAGLSNVVAIAAGYEHSAALRADGIVVAWGSNEDGRTNVPSFLTDGVALAAGWGHNLVLRANGTVVAWGMNLVGETDVPAGLSNVVAIAAGEEHNLALRADGTVVGWGYNENGQADVPAGLSNVVAIAAGGYHSLALRADGTVVLWGEASAIQGVEPASLTNIVAIAAGEGHCLAVRADGTVIAWGLNGAGQTNVIVGLSNVVAVAGGELNSLALRGAGPPFLAPQVPYRVAYEGGSAVFSVQAAGQWPLSYQWFYYGEPIAGANQPWLVLENVALGQGGLYTVEVSNELGMASAEMWLEVKHPAAPYILREPRDLMVTVGKWTEFVVEAAGPEPWSFQWYFQGSPIPLANQNYLTIFNARFENDGEYYVVVQNEFGAVTSRVARLTVYPPPPVVTWGANWGQRAEVPPDLTNVISLATWTDHCLAATADGRVRWWGTNHVSTFDIPDYYIGAVVVAAGEAHALVLKSDGTVEGWGNNFQGQLDIPADLTNAVAISAGLSHNVALRADGTVTVWGGGAWVQPPAGLSNVVAVAAGGLHTLALLANGTVVAWGDSLMGQLDVPSGLSNVVAISAGYAHNLALCADGTVVAWGYNNEGQINVPPGLSNVVGVSAGFSHSLALRADGTVVGWGSAQYDVTQAPASLSNVVQVAAGLYFSMALVGQGPPYPPRQVALRYAREGENIVFEGATAGRWPLSYQWYFNDTPIAGANRPWLVVSNVQPVHAGAYHVVVANAEGMATSQVAMLQVQGSGPPTPSPVVAWGSNAYGQSAVPPGLSNVVGVAAGEHHSLALRADGTVVAWGDDTYGQGSIPAWLAQVTNIIQVAAAYAHNLALLNNGTVVAWGNNWMNQLDVPDDLNNVVAISANAAHNLALRADGTVVAWGANVEGQCDVPDDLHDAIAISAGEGFSLALRANGTVVGWGDNTYGQASPPPWLSNVVAIAAGGNHSLALCADGTVVGWGNNDLGQLSVPSLLSNVVAIAAGGNHSVALQADGKVWVWGEGGHGELLVPLGLSNVVVVAAGFSHTVALVGNGPPVLLPQVPSRAALQRYSAVFAANAVGQWPLSYQWYRDGNPIPEANRPWLLLTNLSVWESGFYEVRVSNALGETSSEVLNLEVMAGTSPSFLEYPEDQVAAVGSTVTFTAVVDAFPPAYLQWYFGDEPIPNATNAVLTLTNVTKAMEGYYHVLAINDNGGAQSFPAYLTVIERDPYLRVNGIFKADGRHLLATDDPVLITLETAFRNGSIYYSTNNLHPDDGVLYTGPFEVHPPVVIKAIAYNSNRTAWTAVVTNRLEIGWEFSLQVHTPGGGSVSVSPSPGPYASNTVVNLSAVPAPGWIFMRWEGDASGTNAVTQVVMNRPRMVQAIFGTTVPWSVVGSGVVHVNPPERVFAYGAKVRLSALPHPGNYFQHWNLGGNLIPASPLDLVLTNPAPSVAAVFAPLPMNTFALNTLVSGEGKVQRTPPANFYTNGTPVLLTALPDPGYVFAGWSGDLQGTNNPMGLVVNGNRTITAHFVEANRVAIVAQPRSQVVQAGDNVTLSVRAVGQNLSYQWFFEGMPVDGGQTSELYLGNVQAGQAGRYWAAVFNDQGDYVESEVAWLTVNRELNPQQQAVLFLGTAADEAALAVAVRSNQVYLGGVVDIGAGEALAMRVPANFTTNTSPVWHTQWPGRPGRDGFLGVLPTEGAAVFAGFSEPVAIAAAGTTKGVLVQINATNGLVEWSRRVPAEGAFDFNGEEVLTAIARSMEAGGEFWYVTGQGQDAAESYGQMFLAKVTPAGSEVWVAGEAAKAMVSGTLGEAMPWPGFTGELPVEYSVGRAVAVMGGAVYVAGRADIEGIPYATLWKFTLDGRLVWRQLGSMGEYTGLAAMNGWLYAVGTAQNFWSGGDFLAEKWSPDGWMAWTVTYDRGEEEDALTGVAAASGRLYACGYTYGGTAGGADAVVLRLDPETGELLATLLAGYFQDDFAHAIAMDGQYLYVAGESFSGGAGGADAVLVRLFVPDLIPNAEPLVAFTSPADGAEFVAPATVTLEIAAADPDDAVAEVQVYQDGMWLETLLDPPYRLTLTNLPAGEYVFSALAVDTRGAKAYAAPVRVAVNNYAASHKLDFEAVLLSAAGISTPLSLSNYLAGYQARVIALTPGSTVQVVRASQVYPRMVKPSSGSNLLEQVSAARGPLTNRWEFDQILDSVRFTRVTVLAGAAGASHPRWRARAFNQWGMELSSVGENALFSPQDIPARTFTLTGPDIAAVVFESDAQNLGAFSSLLLDDLVLNVALSANSAPLVLITSPPQKAQFEGPANVTVQVAAEDFDGQVDSVALLVNNEWHDWAYNTRPGRFEPSFVLTNLVVGTYRLVAVAFDNEGAWRESPAVSFSVVAPAPPNDHFANRLTLTGLTATYSGNSAGATFEPGEPYHAGVPGGRSVWFAWTAPQDGLVTVSTAGSSFDTVLAVYTGNTLTLLEPVEANDDDPTQSDALTSRLWFQARRGQTYVIAVDGYNGAGGFYALLVSMNMPPTVAMMEPLPGAIYTAPGPVVLRAQAQDSDGVARVEFYRGNTLVGAAVNQPPGTPFTAQVTLTNVAPGEYYFRARAVDASGVAAETLPARVTVRPAAAGNDFFANARLLTGPVVMVTDDNRGATREPGEPDPWGGLGGNSLWYRWTAPASGTVLISTLGSSFDTLLAVYTGGTLQDLLLLALDDDSGEAVTAVVGVKGAGASLISMEVVAGVTYYLAVEGYWGAGGDVRLSLAFNLPPTVQLTLNTNLARFTSPGIIPLVATALDDSSVKQVDFFLNEEPAGTVVNPAITNRFMATLTLSNLPAGDYVFTARVVDDLGAAVYSPPLAVTILGVAEEPEILARVEELEVLRGEKIELSVTARGTPPLRYQWFFNGMPLWGANSAVLVIPNASPANSGLYFARVSNDYGSEDSEATAVRVFVPPVITVPPASVTLPPGTSAVFMVTAVGTPPLRYQWYRHQTPIAGATAAMLVITNVSPWEMGAYTVVVSNRAGQAQATAQLTVSAVLAPPAAAPRDDFWVPDGPVHALAESGGTLYLGGNFRMVGPNTGLGVALDPATARPDTVWPRVEGTGIYAVVPDGEGGWFVGGDFVRVGGLPRTNLAHLLPDKTVDPAWTLDVNGPVRALLLDEEILYVGGEFTRVAGQVRTNLAAIRTQDNTVRAFAPHPDGAVRAIVQVDSKLYVAGAFLNIGGLPRARLAKVDPSDGQVRTDFVADFDRTVHALAVDDHRLFVAGEFDTVTNNNAALARPKIALIDTEERSVLGWRAPLPAGPGARVYALALREDTLYAGGDFSFTSGGVTYRHLAAFGRADGGVRPWNPGAGGVVRAVVADENAVFAGGMFLTMGSQPRMRLAALDPETGAVLDWQAPANGAVRALAFHDNTLFAGGQFTVAGGVMRSNVAAMRLATGQPTSWNPGANAPVRAIRVSGTNVYVGGEFTVAGRQPRSRLAAISALSGDATPWNPGANGTVRALALSGKRLFAGGEFTLLANAARSYVGAVDTDTAAALEWNPAPDGPVLALQTSANGALNYLAGEFNAFNGTARPFLARVDASGALDGWSPLPNAPVMALALREGPAPVIYAGGSFTVIGGAPRQRLAALDDTGLAVPSFAPAVQSATGDVAVVRALGLRQSTLDVGGWYQLAGGASRNHLAALNAGSGEILEWHPDLTVPAQALGVQALAASTNVVIAGGDFTRVGGDWRPNLAVFAPRGAPIIVGHPRGRVVAAGGAHQLSVTARGAWPLYFQWRLNGVNLPGATNATLTLTNIQLAQCGAYSVVASTPYGVAESQPAEVLLAAPQAALGDFFTNSVSLPAVATGVVMGVNTAATGAQDDLLPGGFKRGGRSVWATWVAPTNGVVTFSTLGSTFDTLLTVLQGDTLNTLLVVERDEDSAGNLNEQVTFPVTMGNAYHLLVDGVEGAQGTILLSWNLLVGVTDYPIITDQPRSRTVPENSAVNLQVTVQNAASYQWFFRGQPIAGATGSSYFIPALTRNLAGPYQVIAYGVNPERRAQSRVFVLEVGQLVQSNQTVVLEDVRTHDKFDDMLRGGGPGGQTLGGPERQFFASVTAGSSGTQVLDNYGATTEPNEPQHGGVQGGASRWFRIDTLTNGVLVIDTLGSEIDTVLAVYTGDSLFTLELVASDDNGAPDGVRSLVRFNAQAGKSYLVAVDGVNGAQGHIVMNYLLALPPEITGQPVHQTVASGGSANFSVSAQGSQPLAYQWYHLRAGQSNALPVMGGTNATLTLANVQAGEAGNFHVVVSNPAGSVTSAVAVLTVEAPLRFAAGGAASYSNGVFTLNITGKAGQLFVIQASTNLSTWVPISTNLATGGQVPFVDPAAGTGLRFYRAVGLE